MDETAISIRGGSRYLYRAVDKFGKTVDSLLCADRSVSAARAFFCKALKTHYPRQPQKLNLDGYAASHRALRLLVQENPDLQSVVIRSSRYLNNIVEQDHRAIKRRCAPMLALKSFRTAAVTLAGVELAHRIRKGQFSLRAGAATGFSSFKYLWARALKRRSARAQARSDEAQPPMQQNSPVRLRTEHDVRDIKPVRYARRGTVGRGLCLSVTPTGGRCWYYRFYFSGKRKKCKRVGETRCRHRRRLISGRPSIRIVGDLDQILIRIADINRSDRAHRTRAINGTFFDCDSFRT